MKKRLYSLMLLLGCCACFVSVTACSDDDDEPSQSKSYCTCTGRDNYGHTESERVYLDEWGASNCSELTHMLAMNTHGVTFSCK